MTPYHKTWKLSRYLFCCNLHNIIARDIKARFYFQDAPLPKRKDNLTSRLKRHESRVNALKKGNALLMANVDRLKDDVLKQREESGALKKELDSLIDDLD